jgi:hypothetical protein
MLDLYEAHVTNITADDYWEQLRACGWLDALPEAEREELRNRVHDAFQADPTRAFYALQTTGFDTECIEGVGPDAWSYHNILVGLAADSRGLFQPTQITDALDHTGRQITVAFDHGTTRYSCTVPFDTDWFDFTVLELVNQALREVPVAEQFIILPPEDQIASLALIPESTYRCAELQRLIPPPEYYEYKIDEVGDLDTYLAEYYADLEGEA